LEFFLEGSFSLLCGTCCGGKLEGQLIVEKGFDPRPILHHYFNRRDKESGLGKNRGIRYLNSQYKFEQNRILIFKDKFSKKKIYGR